MAPDLSLLAAVEAALLPHVRAAEAAADPSLDPEPFAFEHESHHEGCDCPACAPYVAEIDVIAAELRAEAIEHQEDRYACGLDVDVDPCPLALIARTGGVAEGRARYARTPHAPHAGRPRFVPTAPVRRAVVLVVRGVR